MSYINLLGSQCLDAQIEDSYYSDTLYEEVIMSGAIYNNSQFILHSLNTIFIVDENTFYRK